MISKNTSNSRNDLKLLEKAGVDAVYVPKAIDIYPEALKANIMILMDWIMRWKANTDRHFDGVGTVVEELLRQVQPHNAYFGEKIINNCHYQKMVEKTNLPVKIHGVPTLRENSGLAMSSRNLRLTKTKKRSGNNLRNFIKSKEWLKVYL
jgi:pantoate--beta-alanine ligase